MPNTTRGSRGAPNPGSESPRGERPAPAQMQRMVASKRMAQEQAKVVVVHDLTAWFYFFLVLYQIHNYTFARSDSKQVDEVIDLMKCNVEKVLERDEGRQCSGARQLS